MNNDRIVSLLYIVLAVMIVILFILFILFIVIRLKSRKPKEVKETIKTEGKDKKDKKQNPVANNVEYNKQSIYSFMDFDAIEDNMIIRKNGKRYVMVVECQGINFDLMSEVERTGVEQGFLQFLNTLRYPIQIYTQTRTVNLESGIAIYRKKLKEVEDRLVRKQIEYNSIVNSGQYTSKEVENQRLEVLRERNLYEYGKDIIDNTERLSLNQNILRKHYYVVLEHMPEETETTNYGKDEIANMAFGELYTKSQSVINALSVCGINAKILDSNELVELLYMAYNRDEAELFGLDKVTQSGYNDLYITAPDVLDKRMKALDKKIEEEGYRKANDTLYEVAEERQKERELKQKEEDLEVLIREMAKYVIDENQAILGKDLVDAAKQKIDKEGEQKEDEEKTKVRRRKTARA